MAFVRSFHEALYAHVTKGRYSSQVSTYCFTNSLTCVLVRPTADSASVFPLGLPGLIKVRPTFSWRAILYSSALQNSAPPSAWMTQQIPKTANHSSTTALATAIAVHTGSGITRVYRLKVSTMTRK